jgi:hypothetical protein
MTTRTRAAICGGLVSAVLLAVGGLCAGALSDAITGCIAIAMRGLSLLLGQ